MPVIAFDKFAMSLFRIWDEAFRETGQKLLAAVPTIQPEDEARSVTFPCPWLPTPGKHGRGLARRLPGSPPQYIVQLIHSLERDGILNYFNVVTPTDAPNEPTHHRAAVRSGIEVTDRDEMLSHFTIAERELLLDVELAFRRMSIDEIRAVGTHDTADNATKDIRKEFDDIDRRGLWDRCIGNITVGNSCADAVREILEYGDEAIRKSQTNREPYRTGRAKFERELRNEGTRRHALNVHRPDPEIWDDGRVRELAFQASKLVATARYVQAFGYFCDHPDERNDGARPVAQALKDFGQQLRSTGSAVTLFPNQCIGQDGRASTAAVDAVRGAITKLRA